MKNISRHIAVGLVALFMVFVGSRMVLGQSTLPQSFWDNVAERLANKLFGQVEAPSLGDMEFGGSGSRFPNGISADSTSPSAGQVRGTTLTVTGASTLASATFSGVTSFNAFASSSADMAISGGTFDLATVTPTTTYGAFIRTGLTATSTLGVGQSGDGDKRVGCVELVTSAGTYARAIIDGTAWNIAAGRCN